MILPKGSQIALVTKKYIHLSRSFACACADNLLHASGIPHLDFLNCMENEHCNGKLSNERFTTRNYGITTCPAKEWAYVLAKEPCPKSDERHIPGIDELMELSETVDAKLIRAEVIAVVLYTGPMVTSESALVKAF